MISLLFSIISSASSITNYLSVWVKLVNRFVRSDNGRPQVVKMIKTGISYGPKSLCDRDLPVLDPDRFEIRIINGLFEFLI